MSANSTRIKSFSKAFDRRDCGTKFTRGLHSSSDTRVSRQFLKNCVHHKCRGFPLNRDGASLAWPRQPRFWPVRNKICSKRAGCQGNRPRGSSRDGCQSASFPLALEWKLCVVFVCLAYRAVWANLEVLRQASERT